MSQDHEDEFWRDDAATSQRAAELKASGLTLPPASKPVPRDPDVVVSHYRPQRRSYAGPVLLVGSIVLAIGVGIWLWLSAPIATMQKYERLQLGMTKAECIAVMGAEPSVAASSQFSFPTIPNVESECICWVNSDDTGAAVVLINGKVTDRMQVGLK